MNAVDLPDYRFPTDYPSILNRINQIDPLRYASSRNYIDGAVTLLSPYISRGVISTRMVMQNILQRDVSLSQTEKLLQELAWRDYWQQVWITKGDAINDDLKHPQTGVLNHQVPENLVNAQTGIEAIDQGINKLYETGYMHNHLRMYVAALACNQAGSHWFQPAKWLYYHLLDADWASNALSWQWVAGSNANKKYIANQQNINKYCHSQQTDSFLDVSYEQLAQLAVPTELQKTIVPELSTVIPANSTVTIDPQKPTLIYNFYNLDPAWHAADEFNRVLLLEPEHFAQYPVSSKTIDFVLKLASNINGIQVFTGPFGHLQQQLSGSQIIYKEHPLNKHYQGIEEQRDWMFPVSGYYPSFFSYWKKCKKLLSQKVKN